MFTDRENYYLYLSVYNAGQRKGQVIRRCTYILGLRMTQLYHRHWQIHVRNRKKEVIFLFPYPQAIVVAIFHCLQICLTFLLFFIDALFLPLLLSSSLPLPVIFHTLPLWSSIFLLFIIVFTLLLFHFAVHIVIYFGGVFIFLLPFLKLEWRNNE